MELRIRTQALIAKPQSGEWVRCSYAGTSVSSQPSSWQAQEKHCTLSGLAEVGFHTNPAKARSYGTGAVSGQTALATLVLFFERAEVRRDDLVSVQAKESYRA